jgi:hypothetical protein
MNMARRVGVGALVVWLGAVIAGFAVLLRYSSTPSQADGATPAEWPQSTHLTRVSGRPTLLLFAHPMCPCTRASVAELGRLMPLLGANVAARVVMVRPAESPADWDGSGLWERAATIPGVAVFRDDGGMEAARFQARTSGLTLLYDADGRLRFRGGITELRGHEGESFGAQRILSLVKTGTADRADAPVFGCALARH